MEETKEQFLNRMLAAWDPDADNKIRMGRKEYRPGSWTYADIVFRHNILTSLADHCGAGLGNDMTQWPRLKPLTGDPAALAAGLSEQDLAEIDRRLKECQAKAFAAAKKIQENYYEGICLLIWNKFNMEEATKNIEARKRIDESMQRIKAAKGKALNEIELLESMLAEAKSRVRWADSELGRLEKQQLETED